MLVVARKAGQRILIPAINTAIEICRVQGETVRVGVDAPRGVAVLREELIQEGQNFPNLLDAHDVAREINHALRGQLQATSMGVELLRKQIEVGAPIEEINETLDRLSRGVEIPKTATVAPWVPLALLVEDNNNERELLAGFLRHSGVKVVTAPDGPDALRYLSGVEKKPDVVLLDMGLPTMCGEAVAEEIKRNDPRLQIFAITGRENNGARTVDRWFQKPLNAGSLLNDIKRIRA